MQDKLPTVTIAIPVLNEEKDIEKVINIFLATRYPNLVEVIVVDGGSVDKTIDIVLRCSELDRRVKLLHNKNKYQSYALNIALSSSIGQVFLRADGHCLYADNYVEKCIEVLLESGAVNVGGAQRYVARNEFQLAVGFAVKSEFGSGGAKYRNPDYTGWAETVFLGCFWKEALRSIGGYNQKVLTNEDYQANLALRRSVFSVKNITNQDYELNYRISKLGENKIYISSKIVVYYFPREDIYKLWKQYFKYGRGRFLTTLMHRQILCRGNMPFIALWTLLFMILYFAYLSYYFIIALGVSGVCLLLCESIRVLYRERFEDYIAKMWLGDSGEVINRGKLVILIAAILATMNLAHAFGFTFQYFRFIKMRKVEW